MTADVERELPAAWKDRLGLTDRRSPELYERAEDVADVPHAPAIRAALDDMDVSAMFCVQGVPTVAIYAADHVDTKDLRRL